MKDELRTGNLFHSERGFALVLTLMILVLITALVTEFSYGVFTTTSALNNWKESQRLSFVAKSGVTLALKTISDYSYSFNLYHFPFPAKLDIPVENILDGFNGTVIVTVEDENARFNLNSIVYTNGQKNSYDSLVALLDQLSLDEKIAVRIAFWINENSVPKLGSGKEETKNALLDNTDELQLVKGIDRTTYEKLLPFVTVHGISDQGIYDARSRLININTASIPVIMSLDANISQEIAERIIRTRNVEAFTGTDDRRFTAAAAPQKERFMGKVTTKPSNFHITVIAEENKIKRVIETVVTISNSGAATIKYWKEM